MENKLRLSIFGEKGGDVLAPNCVATQTESIAIKAFTAAVRTGRGRTKTQGAGISPTHSVAPSRTTWERFGTICFKMSERPISHLTAKFHKFHRQTHKHVLQQKGQTTKRRTSSVGRIAKAASSHAILCQLGACSRYHNLKQTMTPATAVPWHAKNSHAKFSAFASNTRVPLPEFPVTKLQSQFSQNCQRDRHATSSRMCVTQQH